MGMQGRQKAVPACLAGPLGQVAEAGAGGEKEAHLFWQERSPQQYFPPALELTEAVNRICFQYLLEQQEGHSAPKQAGLADLLRASKEGAGRTEAPYLQVNTSRLQ